ncbi:MAG: hypothetical protein ABJH68_11555 [Ilumatobacter sp.]|uniref:hypothetical protein n=1 Tax=Ilumatobacter sp. TaxID=1967498 RepID=UPI0032980B19
MTRRLITTFAAAATVLALTACGGSSDGGSSDADGASTAADDLVALMVDQGAPQDEAECIAEKLDGVSVDELTTFFEAVDDGEDVVATEGVAERFINANAECTLVE